MRQLSDAEATGLCADYEAGVSIAELGERYRLGRTAVFAHVRRAGVETRADRRRLSDLSLRGCWCKSWWEGRG